MLTYKTLKKSSCTPSSWAQEHVRIIKSESIDNVIGDGVLLGADVMVHTQSVSSHIDYIYLSPSYELFFVVNSLYYTSFSNNEFETLVAEVAKELSSWSVSEYDKICSEHYYRTEGQAFRIVDILARAGLSEFYDFNYVSSRMELSLSALSIDFVIIDEGAVPSGFNATDTVLATRHSSHEAVLRLSSLSECSADEIKEFYSEQMSVCGATVIPTESELQFCVSLFGETSKPIFSLSCFGNNAYLRISLRHVRELLVSGEATEDDAHYCLGLFRAFIDATSIVRDGDYLCEISHAIDRPFEFSRALSSLTSALLNKK